MAVKSDLVLVFVIFASFWSSGKLKGNFDPVNDHGMISFIVRAPDLVVTPVGRRPHSVKQNHFLASNTRLNGVSVARLN
jgi:hypothetical protein